MDTQNQTTDKPGTAQPFPLAAGSLPFFNFTKIVGGNGWSAAEFVDNSPFIGTPRAFRMNQESLRSAIKNWRKTPQAEAQATADEYERALQILLANNAGQRIRPLTQYHPEPSTKNQAAATDSL